MGLGETNLGPCSSSHGLAIWPRAPGEVGNLSVGATPTWGGIPEEEDTGTVLGGARGSRRWRWPGASPSHGVPPRAWDNPSPWTGLGRTCSAECVQGARQLRAGEAIEARSLAEEGEARVRTRRPARAARPVPRAGAQPQVPLLLEIVAWGRKVGQRAQTPHLSHHHLTGGETQAGREATCLSLVKGWPGVQEIDPEVRAFSGGRTLPRPKFCPLNPTQVWEPRRAVSTLSPPALIWRVQSLDSVV